MSYYQLGKHFGYPECCIIEFNLHVDNRTFMTRPLRKLSGTGYIPCENCNTKYTTKELIENINKERNDKLPKFSVRI